jgi:MoaA/NifB/PqqE/SkfB family radical SAM enzyme
MRRPTEYAQKPSTPSHLNDDRLQGEGNWKKLPYFWFLLFLSYRCTRRCSYCYAFNQVGDGNTSEMDENTFSRLLDWIPEVWEINDVKVNALDFLGGEPLLRTDLIKKVMDTVCQNTNGMQGIVNTNGDLVDTVNWDDLEAIQWITTNITDTDIIELSRRMDIIKSRSNVINQTIAVTLDDDNLERLSDITRFGLENGYRLRYNRNLYKGLDVPYRLRLLKKYHELCDVLEDYAIRGFDVHTTFLLDTLLGFGSLPLPLR